MKLIIQTKHLIRNINKNELNNEILVINDKDNIINRKILKNGYRKPFSYR